ncbi:hypothetical protein ACFFIY_12215 [Bhargavaea ullalensis]|uniref:Uncharacterized protein n=1 Tax=Bhargavaea ullalensis TaxID=1265685 RepID=A0ABV2G7H8_9BACL
MRRGRVKINKKKIYSFLIGVGVFLLSFSLFELKGFAQSIKIDEWIETEQQSSIEIIDREEKKSASQKSTNENFLLLHNNGEPINTNIINGKTDFYLEAISKNKVNGMEVIDYYFNQVDNKERDLSDIKETASERSKEILNDIKNEKNIDSSQYSTFAVASVSNPVVRNFNWTFNSSSHYLTTTVEMSRRSSNASINGVKGSVWDVITNTQYERKTGLRYLNNLYTRLAVPYTYQTLLDWGPASTNSGDVSVSLSGAGVPGISYNFSTGTLYNTSDLSSKSSKYGRWKFSRAVYPVYANRLTTRPAIRSSNTKGNFALQLSHSLVFDNVTNNTGVITITTPDR